MAIVQVVAQQLDTRCVWFIQKSQFKTVVQVVSVSAVN